MKKALALLLLSPLSAFGQATTVPYQNQPILSQNATKVSEHVWTIIGFPNVAIVVGKGATLVVDTGLGPANGATVAKVAARLAPANTKLFLTSTHYHPEHAGGDAGFPAGTILIRNAVQQKQVETDGDRVLDNFRSASEQNRKLLAGVKIRAPDVLFDKEIVVDLGGGVKTRLLWLGGAHTRGDQLALVEPDQTLISGDVVQDKTVPFIYGTDSTPKDWETTIEKVAALNVAHVLPDHSSPGDGSMVTAERDLIVGIRKRALELKAQGVSPDAAGKQISAALKQQHPDWENTDVSDFVKRTYLESEN